MSRLRNLASFIFPVSLHEDLREVSTTDLARKWIALAILSAGAYYLTYVSPRPLSLFPSIVLLITLPTWGLLLSPLLLRRMLLRWTTREYAQGGDQR